MFVSIHICHVCVYDGWMNEWMDGWMDGWTDGWMCFWRNRLVYPNCWTSLWQEMASGHPASGNNKRLGPAAWQSLNPRSHAKRNRQILNERGAENPKDWNIKYIGHTLHLNFRNHLVKPFKGLAALLKQSMERVNALGLRTVSTGTPQIPKRSLKTRSGNGTACRSQNSEEMGWQTVCLNWCETFAIC